MKEGFQYIELFAGCGGLSLGLEAAGFKLHMANELSPMAGETFAYNMLGEDLQLLAEAKQASSKVIWIKSQSSANNLHARLRENPFEFSKGDFTDLNENIDLDGKLVIGDIDSLIQFLENSPNVKKRLREENIDLLSGGPPCQGFSMAGKRIKDDLKNTLPLSFAKFAGYIQPKIVLLENVRGITSPFTTEDGSKHYAWLEVAKAFSISGFYPVCMLLNSKYFGVPQNRPRFIMLAFRKDIFNQIKSRKSNSKIVNKICKNSLTFYEKVIQFKNDLNNVKQSDLALYHIEKLKEFYNGEILPNIVNGEKGFVKVSDAIKDISNVQEPYNLQSIKNKYALKLSKTFKKRELFNDNELHNHEYRKHTFKVKARFRLYQVLSKSNGLRNEVLQVISGNNKGEKLKPEIISLLREESYLFEKPDGTVELKMPEDITSLTEYFKLIGSRKRSQRALKSEEPAPAQLTIPDDLCHYSPLELRTLTVREVARIQSFPDWFVFRSKITTGGNQRSFEVPQYTQAGNAVPPLLAYELGKTITGILETIQTCHE
jgi:DNA (cytosine-5)-methyltransferase 1